MLVIALLNPLFQFAFEYTLRVIKELFKYRYDHNVPQFSSFIFWKCTNIPAANHQIMEIGDGVIIPVVLVKRFSPIDNNGRQFGWLGLTLWNV